MHCKHLQRMILVGILLLVSASTGYGQATTAKVAFRNDGPSPIVVQGTVIVNGIVQRSKPLMLPPTQAASWDAVPKGNTLVTVYDGTRPNRILFQGSVPVAGQDLYFSVQPEPPLPRAKLVPVPPPAPPRP